MLSERSKRVVLWLAIAFFGLASVAVFVGIWAPFFSFPEKQDAAAMFYGVIPLTWTMAAFVIVPIGLVLGRVLPLYVSAPFAAVVLAGAIGFVLWKLSPMARSHPAPAEVIITLGVLLLPPLMFGWLVGYGRRVCRAASVLSN